MFFFLVYPSPFLCPIASNLGFVLLYCTVVSSLSPSRTYELRSNKLKHKPHSSCSVLLVFCVFHDSCFAEAKSEAVAKENEVSPLVETSTFLSLTDATTLPNTTGGPPLLPSREVHKGKLSKFDVERKL